MTTHRESKSRSNETNFFVDRDWGSGAKRRTATQRSPRSSRWVERSGENERSKEQQEESRGNEEAKGNPGGRSAVVEFTITQHWSQLSQGSCRRRGIDSSWSASLLITAAASTRASVLWTGEVGVAACRFTTGYMERNAGDMKDDEKMKEGRQEEITNKVWEAETKSEISDRAECRTTEREEGNKGRKHRSWQEHQKWTKRTPFLSYVFVLYTCVFVY